MPLGSIRIYELYYPPNVTFPGEIYILLEHGGRLNAAAARYGIALSDWLDLSTGINPNGWPVPSIPVRVWNRLPEPDDALIPAAQSYYRAPHLLPVAGSQAAIQVLPTLRACSRVGVISPGYNEHAHAWRRAGHEVLPLAYEQIEPVIASLDVLVLIHPNNPSGHRFNHECLLRWHAQLAARKGWLVVDEAFMDATPEHSLAEFSFYPGLIVLRSLGKFFGLAGARVGFVCAAPEMLRRIESQLGPWTVCGPARYVATRALQDTPWQTITRERLLREVSRLTQYLSVQGWAPSGGTALFQWVVTPFASRLHEALARRGLFTRLFTEPASLRLGLPATEAQWQRLESALAEVALEFEP